MSLKKEQLAELEKALRAANLMLDLAESEQMKKFYSLRVERLKTQIEQLNNEGE